MERDDETGSATVVEPAAAAAKAVAMVASEATDVGDASEATDAGDEPTAVLAAGDAPDTEHTPVRRLAPAAAAWSPADARRAGAFTGSQVSLTTAVDAMRDEEVERTRLFIRLGWIISLLAIAMVPLVDGTRVMTIAIISAMIVGIVVSLVFHQRFADPKKYTDRALLQLAVMCIVNASVAVLFFGVFTPIIGLLVIGIHFVARTEAERVARWIFATAVIGYALTGGLVLVGVIADPGVLASDHPLSLSSRAIGAAFVLGAYVLAYVTARAFRRASIKSIDDLQRATRVASQREALMDELRADLERALRIGGPGRYTDQQVGAFKLGVVLGRGAMGEVYEATDTQAGGEAAVKLLRRELLTDPTQVARFLREVKASGGLASPHVVRVLGASAAEDTLPYLAMELLSGATLSEILREQPRISASETLELIAQIGEGIDAANAAGIVHRDLKPQNLFRAGGTTTVWKVLDFGVATLSDDTGTLTQGGIVGTPNYMAPEQAQGKRVDGRADVYAIAAVAYRCLTGRHPFSAPDTPALLYAVVHRMPMRPTEAADGLAAELDRWFAVALAKAPDDRFPTGAALAASLRQALTTGLDAPLRKRADALMRKHPWE